MLATRLTAVAAIAVALSAPAKADVIYNLTFGGGGTGELILNASSLAALDNISTTSIQPYFVSLSAANVDGQSFSIDASNLAGGSQIQTGSSGQIYTLTVLETQPTGVSVGTDYLQIYTGGWQVHSTPYDSDVANDNLSISAPMLLSPPSTAAAPEPSTLAVMLAGVCGLGFLAARKRRGSRYASGS